MVIRFSIALPIVFTLSIYNHLPIDFVNMIGKSLTKLVCKCKDRMLTYWFKNIVVIPIIMHFSSIDSICLYRNKDNHTDKWIIDFIITLH